MLYMGNIYQINDILVRQTSGEVQNFTQGEIQILPRFWPKLLLTGQKAPNDRNVPLKYSKHSVIQCIGEHH